MCNHSGVTTKTEPESPRYKALLQLLSTAETVWNASRTFFARWELSPSQFNVLNLLQDYPGGCTQIELSRLLIMHRSNITGLVDRLEQRGLVQRHDSDTDRRAYLVALTPKGQTLLRKILPEYYQAAENIWGNFPGRRTTQLTDDLVRLAANVKSFAQKSATES